MQDRYVGDVGDFGKYALLRKLSGFRGGRTIRLAVIWCYFPNEFHSNDGRHVSYLRAKKFNDLDSDLYVHLQTIVKADRRAISSISNATILPEGTVYCAEPISPSDTNRLSSEARLNHRLWWLNSCIIRTGECELIFFDPDNGMEVASVPKNGLKSGKYIYWDELMPFWRRGNALLIYHHLNRTTSAPRQVELLAQRFATNLDGAKIVPLVYRRGSLRVFWLIHRGDNLGSELERRAAEMLSGGWSEHFRPFGWPSGHQASTRA
jgi:hypothetical protein